MSLFRQALATTTMSTLTLLLLCTPAQASSARTSATERLLSSNAPAATYVVKDGDYLTGIAIKVGAKVSDLLAVNKLKITSVIHPGDTLLLPAGAVAPVAVTPVAAAPAAPAATALTLYTVKSGESLSSIANSHGVKLFALLKANKMTVTSVIHPGLALNIPPATMPIPLTAAEVAAAKAAATAASNAAKATASAAAATAAGVKTISVAAASSVPKSIATVLNYLQEQVGKPYRFNAEGPDAFDCSGLVTAAYAKINVSLPHQSLVQSTYGTAVDWKTQTILPGDLVFMYSSANPGVISHVGIAIDSNTWIQAARTGTPVRVGPMPRSEKIQAVRRIVQG